MNLNNKLEIGKEVSQNVPTPTDPSHVVNKEYVDNLFKLGDSITDSYDTMVDLYADQANQIDGELFVVIDASAHSTVDAGWAFFEYLGSTTGTETDYRKLSEEESLDVVSGSLFVSITANQYGTHPAFSEQDTLNGYFLQRLSDMDEALDTINGEVI